MRRDSLESFPRVALGSSSFAGCCHPGWRRTKRFVAPRAGFAPAAPRLTAACSTVELPGNETCWRTPWGSNPARRVLTRPRNHQMCLESVFVFFLRQFCKKLLGSVASGAEGQIRTGAGRVRADRASATPPRRTKTGDEPGFACCYLAPGVRVERTFPVSETGGLPLADPGSTS